ncbi:SnoaL-like polyketide cyclase [Larkinella arboricola]|uniref:SnoaL-like polyketide cyclase n=1 Tax=Larkinella arboricola TaxID=643671 RepID=A0A327WR69_LARAB|nr:ester cyclase [Larkinella arboricola]RAJ91049.1 SnoaL-like polyketide cyclase [Larkinella arboricola]
MNTESKITEARISEMSPIEKVLFFWGNVWSHPHDVDLIDLLMVEDFAITTAGEVISGREAFKNWVIAFLKNVKNSHLENLDIFESQCGTKVVSRWKLTGLNNGILGLNPDQRPIELYGTAIWLIRDGKLAHNWVERNSLEVYRKLQNPANGSDITAF